MDFSLTSLFVVPVGETVATTGSTQDLIAGKVGIYKNDYAVANAGNIAAAPYFYIAQGRSNTYLQGSKRSDKIPTGNGTDGKIIEWYKTGACPTPTVEIWEIGNFAVKCGEVVTLTLRAHSSYIDTLYFNGFTRSVTVQAPCCDCGADPCTEVDAQALVDSLIVKLTQQAPGINPDNISFNTFYTFSRSGSGASSKLVIAGKPLTAYGQPCDVAAFPWEYDRMWFRAFIYKGPATTADFIVADACDIVATPVVVQRSSYPSGTSAEIAQLEKDYYSYQAGYLKHLYRMGGYNYNFESYVTPGTLYDTYYIKYKPAKEQYTWGDYIVEDAMVILAVPQASAAAFEAILVAGLGAVEDFSATCPTTTTSTTTSTTSTTSTTTLIP
jgi:hypothetical protein